MNYGARSFYLLIAFFLIASSETAALEAGVWGSIKNQVTVDKKYAVIVSNVMGDAELGVFYRGNIVRTQNVPQEVGFGAFFFLEYADKRPFELKLRRSFETDLPFTAVAKKLYFDDKDELALRHFDQALEIWGDNTREAWLQSSRLAAAALEKLKEKSAVKDLLLPTFHHMLYELDDYSRITNGTEGAGSCLTDLCAWEMGWLHASALRSIGEFDEALNVIRPVVVKLDQLQSPSLAWQLKREYIRSELATSLMISGAFRRDQQRMGEAKNILQRVRRTALELGDSRLAAIAMNNISPYYFENGHNAKAEELILKSIELHKKAGMSKRLGDALNNLAYLYESDERADLAIDALSEAMEIESQYPLRSEKGFLQLRLGKLYLNVGDSDSASLNFKAASQSFASIDNQFYAAIATHYLGTAYRNSRMFKEALGLHQAGAKFFREEQHPIRYFNAISESARDQIAILSSRNAAEDERQQLTNSIELMQRLGLGLENKEKVNLQLVLSEYYLFRGDYAMFFQSNLEFKKLMESSGQKTYAEQQAAGLELEVMLFLETGELAKLSMKASEFYLLARSKRSKLRKTVLDSKWSHRVNRVVELHAQGLFNAWKATNDRAKLYDLFNLLENHNALSFRASRNNTRLAQNDLPLPAMREARDNENMAVNGKTKKQRQDARQRSTESRFKIDTGLNHRSAGPLVHLNIKQIQAKLGGDEKVLRFYVRDNISLVFEILRDQWAVHELAPGEEIKTHVNSLLDEIAGRGSRSIELTKELSKVLDWQKINDSRNRKVIYLADGVISRLPLGMLHTGSDEGKIKASIEQADWVRTLSLSEYFSDFPVVSNVENLDLAIFADPIFNTGDLYDSDKTRPATKNQVETFRSWANKLQRLPGTAKEAGFIKALYPNKNVKILVGRSATNEALLSQDVRSAKVVHIASHGYFNESTPNIVGIATTPFPGSSLNTGFLTLTELTGTTYRSNLIVISGCETLLGEHLNGEGVMGLTRGLLSRGAGSVIGTLWSIPDGPSAYFMKSFYEHLKELDGDAAMALTKAKLDMKSNPRYRHAFYWAGYVLDSANRRYDFNAFQ